MTNKIRIRRAEIKDAEMLTELCWKTFWDAFHEHPENAPEDMADYMEKAFNVETIRAELAEENSIFLVAEIEGAPAGYAKITLGAIEDGITAKSHRTKPALFAPEIFGQRRRRGVDGRMFSDCKRKRLRCDVARRLGI